ncbi:uncharacterized protein LOC110689843 [Chenopodium quinoa]|uniref:uncharacterized protein LOC110689843 n=1 Tax=Chenopodium quinoa TaxID=63459 RepID=UPI000B7804AA|nr:uncharacterized protein LOC110689843 [Chenopodium quinoa]
MEENLLKDWEKFRLTEDEEAIVCKDFEEATDEGSKSQICVSLIGKMLTGRPFNFEAMKKTLTSIWRLHNHVAIRMIETNLFVFQFFSIEDKERILEGCPWSFDNQILCLKEIHPDEQPSDIQFTHTPFWVRLLDVPFGKRNSSFAYDIGECLGGYLDYDSVDYLGWDEFMRIKVMIDIRKPLRRGVRLATGKGEATWLDIKYKRLGDFCYYCGRLSHTDRNCHYQEETVEKGTVVVYQYGT